MKLKSIGSNQTVVTKADGTEVLYSYSTPVAAFIPGRGMVQTSTKYSTTTSRHVNKWGAGNAPKVDQSELDNLS